MMFAALCRRAAVSLHALLIALLLQPTLVYAQARVGVSAAFCGPLYVPPASPPWDFRRDKHFLPIVENAHFTPQVEFLIRGDTGNRVGPDLNYTLGRFPNHPRALVAVVKLHKRNPNTRAELLPRPVECYFERAIRFAPDDPVVRMLYADFLIDEKREPEAQQQLEFTTARLAGGSLITHYNVGLLYLKMKSFARALEQAHKVESLMEQGMHGANVLRQELERAGQWRDAPPADAASAASGAASAVATGR